MAPNISIREYIRELPENATEPTITIVLTSAESRFVDVRIYKAADGGEVAPEKEGNNDYPNSSHVSSLTA